MKLRNSRSALVTRLHVAVCSVVLYCFSLSVCAIWYFYSYNTVWISQPIGGARQSAAPLNSKILADIQCVITGDLASNCDRIMRFYAGWTRFTHLHAVFSCSLHPKWSRLWRHILQFCGTKCVKFCDPRLNCSGEVRPKAAGGSIFGRFSNFDQGRLEVAGDVMYIVATELVFLYVRAKLGDSRLNSSQLIRLFGWPYPFDTLFFCAVFNCILQSTGSSWWCHIWQVCATDCPQ